MQTMLSTRNEEACAAADDRSATSAPAVHSMKCYNNKNSYSYFLQNIILGIQRNQLKKVFQTYFYACRCMQYFIFEC